MPATAVPPAPPLRFVGGDPSLDLVNTADWTARGPVAERLARYDDLLRWAVGARVVGAARASRLRREAARRPRAARAALAAAHRARSVLARVFWSVAEGEPERAPWRRFETLLGATLPRLRVEPPQTRGAAARWAWRGEGRLDSVLWPAVRAAAELLTSDEAAAIRRCAGPDCGWVFVDRSRNHLRRWCDMRTCGTLAKGDRRRARRAGAG